VEDAEEKDRSDAKNRVLRGGSFSTDATFVRSAARSGPSPGSRNPYVGLRVARTCD